MERIYDMVIVGGGPGGYTAALYAARAGLSVAVVEKLSAGGQMALTPLVENYPGFTDGVDGFELAEKMQQGAERFGAETILAQVNALQLRGDLKKIQTSEGDIYGKTVVIATGASPRELGLPQEQALIGRGVGYCAHCDGMFYRNKTVVIVGGGNSAAADALHMSRIAKKVILVHRRDTLRATKVYHKPLLETPNVEFLWNSAVTQLHADGKLNAVTVKNLLSGEQMRVDCDGLFVSIGRKPASELVRGQLALDENGYISAKENTQTEIPGVFAIGDVRVKELRQIVTAVADGALAAHHAEEYLSQQL